ncbi:MAG: AMP-binding protein [Spirochaetales bacterium]
MATLPTLGELLQTIAQKYKRKEALIFEGTLISYQELEEQSNKVANALQGLGLRKGDRVAIMLPNIPEFVYTFFGVQKLGAIAVPFNTMYKGREITHILNDSGARAIVTLTNFANLINEIRFDTPALEYVILTGQRTLIFGQPDSTVVVQAVFERTRFSSADEVFYAVGEVLIQALKSLGVEDAWYKHQGSIRAHGKKIATILLSTLENLYILNSIVFLDSLNTDEFFKVVWVPPEIKDKALEPLTSVREETGKIVTIEKFKNTLLPLFQGKLQVELASSELKRDELFAYEKNRALAYRK